MSGVRVAAAVGLSVLIGVLAALLTGIYPVSVLYGWLEARQLGFVWWGLAAGVTGGCVTVFLQRRK